MKYIFLSFTIALFACNSTPEATQKEVEKKETVDSIITPAQPAESTAKTTIAETGDNCKHGEAKPILKKGSFPKTSFELQSNKSTGIETIHFDNGDKLIIKNWGCDYDALTFRFETNRFHEEPSNAGFWYKRAVTLMNEINKKLEASINVAKGTERLVTQIEEDVPNGYENLKLNEELDFEDGPIRTFVCIDKVEKLDEKRFAVEVTFAKGPL